jgi:serine O-acetyltransferase
LNFLSNQNPLRTLIKSDLYRYFGRTDWKSFLYCFFRVPGFQFSFFLRAASYFVGRSGFLARTLSLASRFLLRHYRFKFGFQIFPQTRIGRGLYIGHHGIVVVASGASLGSNVNLAPGVAIGQTNRGSRAGCPSIGDRVWVGTNAIIVGAITVGDDALIAPGAFVNFDVPPKSVVIGNPGRVCSGSGSEHYVNNVAD